MIFGQDRHELRKMYVDAWRKHLAGRPMSPLEAQIADVIAEHPEYRDAITGDDLDRDYTPEGGRANPFLHMGLHLGIREQVATDRPAGIAADQSPRNPGRTDKEDENGDDGSRARPGRGDRPARFDHATGSRGRILCGAGAARGEA